MVRFCNELVNRERLGAGLELDHRNLDNLHHVFVYLVVSML
jgi:hypothetical protein